jgi:hypothetical protein
VSDALLGLAAGFAAGAVMTRHGLCFNRALRRAVLDRRPALLRAFAIAGFAAGELLIRGPGDGLIELLDDASRPAERGLPGLLDAEYTPLALAVGCAALAALLTRRRDGLLAGVALGAVAAGAWVAADAVGYGYGLGFVGAADGTRAALEAGTALPFELWLAAGVLGGGAVPRTHRDARMNHDRVLAREAETARGRNADTARRLVPHHAPASEAPERWVDAVRQMLTAASLGEGC